MKKTLYLMRHGQTLFNSRHLIQGWCDSPLTELGKKQAAIAGEYFTKNNIVPDHYYCSTSERCSDTLELAVGADVPYTRLKGLKEWNFGTMEGESEQLNPPLPYGDFFKTYYHGEGEQEMRQRMNDTLSAIMAKPDHNVVLAVSHGGSSMGFLRYWQKNQKCELNRPKGGMPNCTIYKYEYEDGEFSLVDVIFPDFSRLEA